MLYLEKALASARHVIASRNAVTRQASDANVMEGKLVKFVPNDADPQNADGVRGHLRVIGECVPNRSTYDKTAKRALDVALSFCGLVVLTPVYLALSIAVYVDDPGPVLFAQKRVGLNKRYFKLHKFRSMKMNTPHDIPTHMLDNPDQYITHVGKIGRAHV